MDSLTLTSKSLACAAQRYWEALRREHIPWMGAFLVFLLLLASWAIYQTEQASDDKSISSFGEALWYGIVTMTTVGYGDLTPHTFAGRIVGVVLMLGGMSLLSLFTATIASILVTEKIRRSRGLETIDQVKDHVLVCGWNQNAERVLEGLVSARRGQVVLVNELPEDAINEVLTRYRNAEVAYVRGDPAIEGVLDRANVRYARAAIVLADTSHHNGIASDERTTLITLAIKSIRANVRVTAEALDMRSDPHLRRAGADGIVITGEFNGFLLSSTATVPGISDVVRGLLSRHGSGLRHEPVPPEFVGRTFGELFQALRSRNGFLALALVAEDKGLTLDDLLTDDHSLVDQFIKQQFSRAGVDYLRFEEGSIHVLVNPDDAHVIGERDTAIGIPRIE